MTLKPYLMQKSLFEPLDSQAAGIQKNWARALAPELPGGISTT